MKSSYSVTSWCVCLQRLFASVLLVVLAAAPAAAAAANGANPVPDVNTSPAQQTTDVGADYDRMQAAIKVRAQLARDIADDRVQVATVLARLRTEKLSGLRIDDDANAAYAALDIGSRLIALQKPVEAEIAFRDAEKSLLQLLRRTPDESAAEKARYLTELATIRFEYLGESTAAMANLDAAEKLQPDDLHIKRRHRRLVAAHGELVRGRSEPAPITAAEEGR